MGDGRDIRIPGILNSLGIGVNVHDPETGRILGTNEVLEEMYGYTSDELREMDIGAYSADGSRYTTERAQRLIRAAADGQPQSFEWHIKRSNGEMFWAHIQLRADQIDDTECVISCGTISGTR